MELTVTIEQDDTRYEYSLSDSFQSYIETTAEHSYEGNEYTELFWDEFSDEWEESDHLESDIPRTNYGDPILSIQTSGPIVPLRRVVQPQEAKTIEPDSDAVEIINDDSKDETDSGEALTFLPDSDDEDETSYDIAQLVQGSIETREEQLDEGRLPRAPTEESKIPQFLQLVPEQDWTVWATAESLLPVANTYYWNIQSRIDYPPVPAQTTDDDREKLRDHSHDRWQTILEQHDCEVVREEQITQDTSDVSSQYFSDDDDTSNEKTDVGDIGARWSV